MVMPAVETYRAPPPLKIEQVKNKSMLLTTAKAISLALTTLAAIALVATASTAALWTTIISGAITVYLWSHDEEDAKAPSPRLSRSSSAQRIAIIETCQAIPSAPPLLEAGAPITLSAGVCHACPPSAPASEAVMAARPAPAIAETTFSDNNLTTISCTNSSSDNSTLSTLVAETVDLIARQLTRPLIRSLSATSYAQSPGLSSQGACSSTYADSHRMLQPQLMMYQAEQAPIPGPLPAVATLAREVAPPVHVPLGSRASPDIASQSSRPVFAPLVNLATGLLPAFQNSSSRVLLGSRITPQPSPPHHFFDNLFPSSNHVPLGWRAASDSLLKTRSFVSMSTQPILPKRVPLGSRR